MMGGHDGHDALSAIHPPPGGMGEMPITPGVPVDKGPPPSQVLEVWPETSQKASLQMLEELSKKANVPKKIRAAIADITAGGSVFQEWVHERRAGYQMMQKFLDEGAPCKEEMALHRNQAQSPRCAEIRPDVEWQVNRRVNNEKMWELDQKIKDMEESLQDAIAYAEKGEPPASSAAYEDMKHTLVPLAASQPPRGRSPEDLGPLANLVEKSTPGCILVASSFAPCPSEMRHVRPVCSRRQCLGHDHWRAFL
jgi:hypothetical protein